MSEAPLSERWPEPREGTLAEIEGAIIEATGNGEFAAYFCRFIREGKAEVAALEQERNRYKDNDQMSRVAYREARAELARLRESVQNEDALTVCKWVDSWWPVLEDGIREWGDDEALERNPVVRAARRYIAAAEQGEEK